MFASHQDHSGHAYGRDHLPVSSRRKSRPVRPGREYEILPAWREANLAPYDWDAGRLLIASPQVDTRDTQGERERAAAREAREAQALALLMAEEEMRFLRKRVEALVAENQRLLDYLQELAERGGADER